MSELQGAVGTVQLGRLEGVVADRRLMAARLDGLLTGLPGVAIPPLAFGDEHAYWRYPLLIDPADFPEGPDHFARALREDGIAAAPRYIQKPAFACAVIADQRTFGDSRFPFTLARSEAVDYSPERFPGTYEYLSRVLVLAWNERLDEGHVDRIGVRIAEIARDETGVRA